MTAQSDKNSDNHPSDFSIEHILNKAGGSTSGASSVCENPTNSLPLDPYSWLQCTRYCPPKIPRNLKRDGPQKRQLGRHPRIPFTSHQLAVLEEKFQQSPYLSSEEVIKLSQQLELADVRVKIWFQNRRARERREKLQQSSSSESQESPDVNCGTRSSLDPNLYHFFHAHPVVTYLTPTSSSIQFSSDNDR